MNFAIIGLGYISERHVKAVYELGHKIIYACDISDSVGWLDKYDKKIFFTKDHSLFYKLTGEAEYTIICTPNINHYENIMDNNSPNVICEKPLITNINLIPELKIINKNIFCIQQLRNHSSIEIFRKYYNPKEFYNINIDYHTPRGNWYRNSWKYDNTISGGILFNIGIHLFDLLIYLFGKPVKFSVPILNKDRVNGIISFKNAEAKFDLSIENDRETVMRDFNINGYNIDLSNNDLHTKSYEKILLGQGFQLKDIEESLYLVNSINTK